MGLTDFLFDIYSEEFSFIHNDNKYIQKIIAAKGGTGVGQWLCVFWQM